MFEKQPANCVHASITRESVMISSTQVLFTEKCTGMNAGFLKKTEHDFENEELRFL